MVIDILLSHYPELAVCGHDIEAARDLIIHTYEQGGKLLLCGNGGSCADCDHITGELLKGFLLPRHLSRESKIRLTTANPDDPDAQLLAEKLQGGIWLLITEYSFNFKE